VTPTGQRERYACLSCNIKMKLGKLTRTLLVSPILLAIYLIPAFIVISIFGFRHSIRSQLVYGLLYLLFLWCLRYVGKRWPTIFGAAAVEGGPRLTIWRAFLLCGCVLLGVLAIVFLASTMQLTRGQTALVYGVVFGSLLLVINLLERRWRVVDEGRRE